MYSINGNGEKSNSDVSNDDGGNYKTEGRSPVKVNRPLLTSALHQAAIACVSEFDAELFTHRRHPIRYKTR